MQKKKPPSLDTKKYEKTELKGTLIAKVNNIPISLEELNKDIDVYNASIDMLSGLTDEEKKEAKIDNREKKIDYLKNVLIRQRLMYQAALDKGLERREDILELLERNRMGILVSALENDILKNIEVSSTEIEEYYKRIKDQLKEPEIRHIKEIVTKTESEARQVLIDLYQGADFSALAQSRSITDSAKKGGDLGELKMGERGERYAAFDEVAFSGSLEKGSIAGPFKGPDGYYIIKIENIKAGRPLSLSEVWDRIKAILMGYKQREALDKFYSDISKNARIEIYEGQIK
ncbi:MAG: peptidyl-prolyl cis-trans isomerase [Candidatus Omnitrophica bacterium]|nr:peptidyl-prolyl cis-trans isomerase [Candidatus Omnitrophota bacterium]